MHVCAHVNTMHTNMHTYTLLPFFLVIRPGSPILIVVFHSKVIVWMVRLEQSMELVATYIHISMHTSIDIDVSMCVYVSVRSFLAATFIALWKGA